jgi:hypothetical protein
MRFRCHADQILTLLLKVLQDAFRLTEYCEPGDFVYGKSGETSTVFRTILYISSETFVDFTERE